VVTEAAIDPLWEARYQMLKRRLNDAETASSQYQLLKTAQLTGAADKAVNLVGCKSPHHQLPEFGWLACPMHAEETKHVLLFGNLSLAGSVV
jgi:phage protein U